MEYLLTPIFKSTDWDLLEPEKRDDSNIMKKWAFSGTFSLTKITVFIFQVENYFGLTRKKAECVRCSQRCNLDYS